MLKPKQWLLLIAILVGVATTASLVPIHAARPGGNVPAGKVFYARDTGHQSLGSWSMNADGSGKQLLAYQPSYYASARLSHLVHQGHRWFLEFRSSPTNGNGVAVFAVRDDGDPEFAVLLADPDGLSLGHFRWAKDDSFLSIAAMPENISPEGVYGYDPDALDRLYAASIAFDPDTGLPALTTPLVVVAEGEQPGQADIHHHDWSPNGDEIVYQLTGNPGPTSALIADLVTGTTRLFAANGWTPVWSPDGTRIAYWTGEGIYVSNLDETARVRITSNNAGHYDVTAGWSLDSQQVLFSRRIIKSTKGGRTGVRIRRAAHPGGGWHRREPDQGYRRLRPGAVLAIAGPRGKIDRISMGAAGGRWRVVQRPWADSEYVRRWNSGSAAIRRSWSPTSVNGNASMTMILLWTGDWPIANPAEYVREGIDHAGVNEPLREYEPSIAAGLTALIRGTREPEKGDD